MAPSKAGGRRPVQAGLYGPEKTERAVISSAALFLSLEGALEWVAARRFLSRAAVLPSA